MPPVIVQNEDGDDVDVGRHTWVEGPCELVLLYIILEIGVCQEGSVTVPPNG